MQQRTPGNAQGIDVSHWQGDIDWNKVAKEDISFVFIKSSQGRTMHDKKFITNVKGARAAGLLVGAYHYLDKSATATDAKIEAQNCFNAIKSAGGIGMFDLPIVLDYEENKAGISKAQIKVVAQSFLDEIQRLTAKVPMIYTYPQFIGNLEGLNRYPLWIARYHPKSLAPEAKAGFKQWNFFQYSDGKDGGNLPNGKKKVNGIAGQVDLNEFAGTVADLKRIYTGKVVVEKPAPAPATDKEVAAETEVQIWYERLNKEYRILSTKGVLRKNVSYVPIKAIATVAGTSYGFFNAEKKASLNEVRIEDTIMIGNDSYGATREVAAALGTNVEWNAKELIVKLTIKA